MSAEAEELPELSSESDREGHEEEDASDEDPPLGLNPILKVQPEEEIAAKKARAPSKNPLGRPFLLPVGEVSFKLFFAMGKC